jgi:dipeptidyl-peptidase-4
VFDRKVTLVESSPPDQLQPKTVMLDYPKAGDPYPKRNLVIFDVVARAGTTIPNKLFADPMELADLRWRTPDEITFIDNERGYQHNRLLGASAAGACRVIIDDSSRLGLDTETYIDYLDRTQELLRLTELQDGWNHLYLYDYATGRVKNCVTAGPGYVDRIESVDEDKRQVLFWACGMEKNEDPYFLHLYRVGFDGNGLVNLTPGNFTHKATFSPHGDYLIDIGSRVDAAPVTTSRRFWPPAGLARNRLWPKVAMARPISMESSGGPIILIQSLNIRSSSMSMPGRRTLMFPNRFK